MKLCNTTCTRNHELESKPVLTPLATQETKDGLLFSNPTLYRSLVRALQYLTITDRISHMSLIKLVSFFIPLPMSISNMSNVSWGMLKAPLHLALPFVVHSAMLFWVTLMLIRLAVLTLADLLMVTRYFYVEILSRGVPRNNPQFPDLVVSLNLEQWRT